MQPAGAPRPPLPLVSAALPSAAPWSWLLTGLAVAASVVGLWWGRGRRRHDEAALMRDGCRPVPWPIFRVGRFLVFGLQRLLREALPPAMYVADLSMGFQKAQVVYAAAWLGLAEALAKGPLDAEALCRRVHASCPEEVERLMSALLSLGLFARVPGTNLYRNNAQSATLREYHPNSVRALVGHWMEDLYPVWGQLGVAIKEGSAELTGWERAYGKGETIWAKGARDPQQELQLSKAMRSLNDLFGEALVADGPFQKFRRVTDVGGSSGHFLARVLRRYPRLTGVVADLPSVIERAARPAWSPGGQFADLAHRVELQAIDFFQAEAVPTIGEGEAALLSLILHDWPDQAAAAILWNLRAKMAPGSTLLLCEAGIPERSVTDPFPNLYLADLLMMLGFRAGERTPSQWRALLGSAGFRLAAIHPTRSPMHFFEAVPA
eukprot:EG_transcript_9390